MRKLLKLICLLLAIVLIAAVAASFYIDHALKQVKRTDDVESRISAEDMKLLDGTKYNILLVGQDRREGQGRQRSDCILLCTLDKETSTMTMTSFMRDCYVHIPDYGDSRINVAYEVGGFPMLYATLKENFGIDVNYGVEVDFDGFISIIDSVGGIHLELTADEAAYLDKWGNWDVTNDKDWTLKEGDNLMNGSQALAYSRIREIGNDFARTGRQRTVLTKLVETLKEENKLKLLTRLDSVLPLITTDMTDGQIIAISLWAIPQLKNLSLVSQRIPADGMYKNAKIKGALVLQPDLEKCRQLLKDTIGVTE